MRNRKVEDDELMENLMSILQSRGYEGASLADLAEASGLKKASLYHRFPGGKVEMAQWVLHFVKEWIHTNIYELLIDQSISPRERLDKALDTLRTFYADGTKICILRALLIDSELQSFQKDITESMTWLIEGFTALAIDLGFSQQLAENRAKSTLISIQGSLIVAKGLGDTGIFKSALDNIKISYLDNRAII